MSLLKYTAEIVRSYVSRNEIHPDEIPELLTNVHRSLQSLSEVVADSSKPVEHSSGKPVEPVEPLEKGDGDSEPEPVEITKPAKKEWQPALPISEAVTDEAIFCLICGKPNKAIRGHLTRTHSMDVATYRNQFNLADDFLMVAPAYSARRRKLAIDAGLGEKMQAGRKRTRKKK